MLTTALLAIIFVLSCVIYNLAKPKLQKPTYLLKFTNREFPILAHAFSGGKLFEIQQSLTKHRDERIRETVASVLGEFTPSISKEMVEFHIKKNLEAENRTPELVHILFQNSRSFAADWENLGNNVKLQLNLIHVIVNNLRIV